MTDRLLEKVKQNLILEHSEDDALLGQYITASVSYAESYQHIDEGYYSTHAMPATTEQAVYYACEPISTKAEMAQRADSLLTAQMHRRRCGTRSICF